MKWHVLKRKSHGGSVLIIEGDQEARDAYSDGPQNRLSNLCLIYGAVVSVYCRSRNGEVVGR